MVDWLDQNIYISVQELQEKERKHSDVIDELRGQYNSSRISSGAGTQNIKFDNIP